MILFPENNYYVGSQDNGSGGRWRGNLEDVEIISKMLLVFRARANAVSKNRSGAGGSSDKSAGDQWEVRFFLVNSFFEFLGEMQGSQFY